MIGQRPRWDRPMPESVLAGWVRSPHLEDWISANRNVPEAVSAWSRHWLLHADRARDWCPWCRHFTPHNAADIGAVVESLLAAILPIEETTEPCDADCPECADAPPDW